jgi:hypothetical protein
MKTLIAGFFALISSLLVFTTSKILLDASGFWEALPWTKAVDVLFASSFTLLNTLNLMNLTLVKLKMLA